MPKKTPSRGGALVWRRIAHGSDSPMRITPKLLHTLDDDDKALGIYKLVQTLKLAKGVPAVQSVVMPLKDRTFEIGVLQNFCRTNMNSYKKVLMRKQDYHFAVVTAGTGFGKTRLCQELPKIVGSIKGVSVMNPITMAKINHATTEEPIGVLLILDEINYLFKSEQNSLPKMIINLIGNFMVDDKVSRQREVGAVIFPVISGTAVNAVKKSFLDSSYSTSPVPIGLLSLDSTCFIFEHCLPLKKHWLDDRRIRRLLLLYGNTPAVLRSIIMMCSDLEDQLTEKIFDDKYDLPSPNVSHIDIVLAGLPSTLKIAKNFKTIEEDGIVYVVNNRYMLPYVYLHAGNRKFNSVSPRLLPTPGVKFSWSDFEKLEHQLQSVRLGVHLALNKSPKIPLVRLLLGAYYPNNMKGVKIDIVITNSVQCSERLLATTTQTLLLDGINDGDEEIKPVDFSKYSFLAAPNNALFDIIEFYNGIRPVVIFKQMKHLENTDHLTTIESSFITSWLAQMRASARYLTSKYICYYMLVTNKKIPAALQLTTTYTDLIIVAHTSLVNYFGPSVAALAELDSIGDA